jgi:hypothetical protein
MTMRASLALCVVVACGGGGHATGFDGGGGALDATAEAQSDDAATSDDGGTVGFGDGSIPDSGNMEDAGSQCPPAAQMVYITGMPAELWSFWPPTFTFKKIGTLTCTSSPTHMTVDRTGTAWVVDATGMIYKTSTKDATCAPAAKWTPHAGFPDFAISLVGVKNTDTTLYLLGATDLASFDYATGAFKDIGPPPVPSTGGDMTSNGDGTLYFLEAYVSPHPLYELKPTNAAVMKTYTVQATGIGSQALAYFGGRFYAFEDNVVNEYDPKTNGLKQLSTAPLEVTGAGQSTCVPQVPVDAGPPQ